MRIVNDEKFIQCVEALINPVAVGKLHFFQSFKKILPSFVFKRLLRHTSKKYPYIGFVIEPYSLFLFFRLKNIDKAKSLLPDRFVLKKTKLFDDDEPEYYFGIGNLSTRASTFWGVRLESYLIAEDKKTGLPSWIFIDILSNTLIALPSKGVVDPNCKNALFTTNSRGELFLDIKEDRTGRRLSLKGTINNGKMRKLDQSIWVMGNTSIGYGKNIADCDHAPFAVIFDPAEVDRAIDIPINDVLINKNTLFPGLAEDELCKVICFPFAQHYIADSPGNHTMVKNIDEMIKKYNTLGDSTLKTFSTRAIEKLFFIGITVSALISVSFLVLLLLKIVKF
ncbi:MAG: hypothetical protein JW881_01030 [Spirochaetales bacterium]|nr:hypothetical protein [Spirochaetales bacterium]